MKQYVDPTCSTLETTEDGWAVGPLDTRGKKCRQCKEPIAWAGNRGRTAPPLDPNPSPVGHLAVTPTSPTFDVWPHYQIGPHDSPGASLYDFHDCPDS